MRFRVTVWTRPGKYNLNEPDRDSEITREIWEVLGERQVDALSQITRHILLSDEGAMVWFGPVSILEPRRENDGEVQSHP